MKKVNIAGFILLFLGGLWFGATYLPRWDAMDAPYEGACVDAKCVKAKSVNVIEIEGYGDVKLWSVGEAFSEEKEQQAMEILRELEGKEVRVWFGDGLMCDSERRPYALVLAGEYDDWHSCVNTRLLAELLVDIDINDPGRLDFIYHPAWISLGQKLQQELADMIGVDQTARTARTDPYQCPETGEYYEEALGTY